MGNGGDPAEVLRDHELTMVAALYAFVAANPFLFGDLLNFLDEKPGAHIDPIGAWIRPRWITYP